MHYSELTPDNTWQCVTTWLELFDSTSETPCGQSELWIPPLGVSDASELDSIISDSGICVFVVLPDNITVTGLHGKYQTDSHTVIWDAMLSLCGFNNLPPQYGIYFTP